MPTPQRSSYVPVPPLALKVRPVPPWQPAPVEKTRLGRIGMSVIDSRGTNNHYVVLPDGRLIPV